MTKWIPYNINVQLAHDALYKVHKTNIVQYYKGTIGLVKLDEIRSKISKPQVTDNSLGFKKKCTIIGINLDITFQTEMLACNCPLFNMHSKDILFKVLFKSNQFSFP